MRLQESSPSGVLAADRCGIKSVAAANVVDGRITHRIAEIVQGPDDAVAAPGWIFFDQFEDEFFEFGTHGWPTDGIGSGKGPLPGDEDTEPTKQRVGSHK